MVKFYVRTLDIAQGLSKVSNASVHNAWLLSIIPDDETAYEVASGCLEKKRYSQVLGFFGSNI